MLGKVLLCVFLVGGVHSSSSLPGNNHIKLGVVMDEYWITKYGSEADQIEGGVTTAVDTVNAEYLKHAEMSVVWLGLEVDSQEGNRCYVIFLPNFNNSARKVALAFLCCKDTVDLLI